MMVRVRVPKMNGRGSGSDCSARAALSNMRPGDMSAPSGPMPPSNSDELREWL